MSSLAASTHPLNYTTGGNSALSRLLPYLGPPLAPMPLNQQATYAHHMLPMYAAQEEKYEYIAHTFDAMARETHNSGVTKYVMPYKREDALKFRAIKHNQHRTLARESVPNTGPQLLQSSREMMEAHMKMYQLGFKVDLQVLNTDDGQYEYEDKFMNLILSFGETCEINSINALVTSPDVHRSDVQRIRGLASTMEAAFAAMNLQWDIIRKLERGSHIMVEMAKQVMSETAITDMLIPEKVSSVISVDPAENEYYRSGPESRSLVKQGADAVTFMGIRKILIRDIYLRDSNSVVSPLQTERVIGKFLKAIDFIENVSHAEYRTADRDMYGLTMKNGRLDLERIETHKLFTQANRFQDDDLGTLTPHHDHLCRNAADVVFRTRLSLKDGHLDMFTYRDANNNYHTVEVLGQMERVALPERAVKLTAASLHTRVMESLPAETAKKITVGLSSIDKLYSSKLSLADLTAMYDSVQDSGPIQDANDVGGPSGVSGTAGLGSHVGLASIATEDSIVVGAAQQTVADNYKEGMEAFHEVARTMFPKNHCAFDPSLAPVYFRTGDTFSETGKNRDSLVTLAQNLLDFNKMPLYIKKAGGNAFEALPGQTELLSGPEFATLKILRQAAKELSVSPLVREAITSVRKFKDFVEAYKKSALYEDVKQQANEEFDIAKLSSYLCQKIGVEEPRKLLNAFHHVVDAVQYNKTYADPLDMVNDWKDQDRQGGLAANNYVLTRFAVSPLAIDPNLAIGGVSAASIFAFGSPHNYDQIIDLGQARKAVREFKDSRRHVHMIGAGRHMSSVTSGNKRSRDVMLNLGSCVEPTYDLTERYSNTLNYEKDPLKRICTQLVLLAPVCGKTFELMCKNDVRVPIEFLIMLPRMRYTTKSIVMCAGGPGLGTTSYALPDFTKSIDGTTKELLVNGTLWQLSLVRDPNRVFRYRDAFVEGYHGGETFDPVAPESFNPRRVGSDGGAALVAMCPYGSLRSGGSVPSVVDIRGHYDRQLAEAVLEDSALLNYEHALYPTAPFYSSLYHLHDMTPDFTEYAGRHGQYKAVHDNTLCFQGHQQYYDPVKKDFSRIIKNTGPFGHNVYPGHGELRISGLPASYENKNYEELPCP